MKKLSLEMLRLTSDEVLERSQMKKITGGYTYTCHCGGANPTSGSFYVWGSSTTDAMTTAAVQCGGHPVTCA